MATDRIEIEISGKADGAIAAAKETEKALEKVIAQTRASGGATDELEKQLAALKEKNAQSWTAEYAKQLKSIIEEQQLAGRGAGELQARLEAINRSTLTDDSGIKILTRGDVARALGETGTAAASAGGNLSRFSAAGGAASQIIAGLDRAGKGGIDAIFGLVAATRAMISAFLAATGPVGLFFASIGLLVGAFVALKDVLFPVKEQIDDTGKKAQEAAERIAATKRSVDEAAASAAKAAAGGIRDMADAYGVLATRADAALQATRALNRAQEGRDDAALEKQLAQIDLAEKQGQLTESQAADQRFGVRQQSEQRRFDREQLDTQRQIARERKTIADAEQKRGEFDQADRFAQSDLERAKIADRRAQIDRTGAEEQRRQALERGESTDQFKPLLGDGDFVTRIRREEEQGRITREEAERARGSVRARGTLGVAEEQSAADLAAAQAKADALAKARAEETARLDEVIVAGRDRIALLERERDLARETFDLKRQTQGTVQEGELIDRQKKQAEEVRKNTFDTEARGLGADVRRGISGLAPAPGSDNAALVRGVNRAVDALNDGATGGELNALYTSVDRLADAAEKQGSSFAGQLRRMQAAVEARIARIEQQMSRTNDAR